jgi:hypothetical protein
VFGLEAALSRYEDAIRHTSAAARVQLRQRLESNAAAMSLSLARLEKDATRASQLRDRAGDHLRIAIALGDALPVAAVRAAWDLDAGSGPAPSPVQISSFPPSASRSRVACLLGKIATKRRGDSKRFTELAADIPGDARKMKIPELLVDTAATFGVTVADKKLRAILELKPAIYFAPRCE